VNCAVDQVTNTHRAQVVTYLKLLNIKRGLLINFNQAVVKYGIHRLSI
jgi:GxxExxY protein